MTGASATGDPAVHLAGLRKQYGPVVAVDGIDLEVARGECFALLGPNGAGKTTTVEICEGLTRPDAGEVVILGQRWNTAAAALRPRLGISLQETRLSEKLTVEETLRLFRSFYAEGQSLDAVLEAVELTDKRAARVGRLSGGQRQRLALACALVGSPELFFLDEPTTGLDPQTRLQLWDLVEGFRRAGRTVVLTTHYMEEAERLCDRVAIIDHGRVIALGTPRELIASLGADHVVEFGVPGDRVDALGFLTGLPGVRNVAQTGGTVRVRTGPVHAVLPALLAGLDARGITPAELRTHTATLEDVFVALTGRHLRDG